VTAAFGGLDLDLRAAVPSQREITLTVWGVAARDVSRRVIRPDPGLSADQAASGMMLGWLPSPAGSARRLPGTGCPGSSLTSATVSATGG
jgi:hypothetical protein